MFKEITKFVVKHKVSSALGIAAALVVGLGKLAFLAEDEMDAEKELTGTSEGVVGETEVATVTVLDESEKTAQA